MDLENTSAWHGPPGSIPKLTTHSNTAWSFPRVRALTPRRRLDERRQRALARYYPAAGAGGLAVGVHTTQFQIRDAAIGLVAPVLELVAAEMERASVRPAVPLVKIAGVCGGTKQAVSEASLAVSLCYHAALLSLGALKTASEDELIAHCRAVAQIIPMVGFYLQPSAGGRVLPYAFWRRFAEIENVVAIKVAAFDRYQTLDVVRAIAETERADIALYTGNDDNIVMDLLPVSFSSRSQNGRAPFCRRPAGSLGGLDEAGRRATCRVPSFGSIGRVNLRRDAAS